MRTFVRAIHKASGKPALLLKGFSGTTWAQFDDIRQPHGYGWHLHFRRDFRVMREKRSSEPRLVI